MPGTGLAIVADASGSGFGLTVKPGARRDRVVGVHGDRLKLEVRAPPERGQANLGVVALLALVLGVRKDQVEIRAGRGGRAKQVRVALAPAEVEARLGRHLESPAT